MRSIWKGAITFGLVHVPVRLYAATEDHDVHFRQLHALCHTPVQYRRYCPRCERALEREEIARAVEVAPGEFVELDAHDLESLPLPTLHAFQIEAFVPLAEVDPVFFERGYYVGPGEGGAGAFALLRAVLADAGRAALGRVALRAKESLALLRVAGPALALETMYRPDEVRPVREVEGLPPAVAAGERELTLARELVERLSTPFQPEDYGDRYREALQDLLERRTAGRAVVRPAAEEGERFADLLAALQESVRLAEARPAAAEPVGAGAGRRNGAGLGPGPGGAPPLTGRGPGPNPGGRRPGRAGERP